MARLDTASAKELGVIRALLESAGLPTSDLESARPEFAVVREEGQVVAAGALQRFGSAALLRSVVVAEDRRGSGLGQMIVCELERLARAAQITELILLTQTAVEFFARQGYRAIERTSAPQDMQTSEEFLSLCASSATCMVKSLSSFESECVRTSGGC
jgi:amino-acid N-acetyltransferase